MSFVIFFLLFSRENYVRLLLFYFPLQSTANYCGNIVFWISHAVDTFKWVVEMSIHTSVNLFSLSHLFRDHWSDFFETCPNCSPSGLVVSARIWFRSVDKYGRRRPSLIFTVIASPPKPQEEFCRNLAYEFPSMSRCVRPKTIPVRQRLWQNGGHL